MKLGILTQPLHSNYGGLLQAWALQKTLVDMGHEAKIINRDYAPDWGKKTLWHRILARIKNELLIATGKRKRYLTVTDELKSLSEQNVKKFRESRYRGISPTILTDKELKDYISQQNFEAYIVGSDQVWRPIYSPNLPTYFLDFVKEKNDVKKIAYAASFGVDNWEFTEEETVKAAELAPLFNLITVREKSGINLVEKYLNCKATQVLDPTMLINKEEYQKLIENSTCQLYESSGNLFCYVLDDNTSIGEAIKKCSFNTGLRPFYCNYTTPFWKIKHNEEKKDCIVPPVEQWLKSFEDAKIVITDSFHGVVFSIIFNKPFWVIINKDRGASRFLSLLKQFSLEDRLISEKTFIDWKKPIDWDHVNDLRKNSALYSKSLLLSKL